MMKINAIENALQKTVSIEELTKNHENTIVWLLEISAIPQIKFCPLCAKKLKLVKDGNKCDGKKWICLCGKSFNLRNMTIFEKHPKIPLIILTQIIFAEAPMRTWHIIR